jgi:hypothetical protein
MPEQPHDLYYERLQLAPGASHEEIVRAYRRLAHGAHPDTHPDDPEASQRFRDITEAYEILVEPTRRDRTRVPAPTIQGWPSTQPSNPSSGWFGGGTLDPPLVLGVNPWTQGPSFWVGPTRIQPLDEDEPEGRLVSGTPTEGSLLRGLFEVFDSLWRR